MSKRLSSKEAFKEGQAVQGIAEETARQEFSKKPEAAHYEMASKMIDQLKEIDPEMGKKFIEMALKGKEIKDKMGPELYKLFARRAEEITQRLKPRVEQAAKAMTMRVDVLLEKVSDNSKLAEVASKEITAFVAKLIEQHEKELLDDEEIKKAFTGKEDLLQQMIEFGRKDLVSFLELTIKKDFESEF